MNRRVEQLEISGIRRFSNMVEQFPEALSLTLGQPDFPTPAHVKEAAKAALDKNLTTYTSNAGLPQLRHAAARFVKRYGLSYDGTTEVLVTNGSTEALAVTFQSLLAPGDEVVLPAPVYPGYEPLIRLAGAVVKHVDTSMSGFRLTPELLQQAITEKTRCVVLPYPANPTGAVLTLDELKALAAVIEDSPLFVVSDEVYSELIYNGQSHHSIAGIPGMRDRTVVLNGLSKSHSMTGWRIGFAFAPAQITAQMLKVHQYYTTCASSISQYAALEALTGGVDDALPMREEYQRRGLYVHQRLLNMGLECIRPAGAFYLFPSIKPLGLPSQTFALRLLQEAQVAVVPGDAFSAAGEGFVRISYAASMATLVEACNRMEGFVQGLA